MKKRALVTGGAKRLGAAMALHLADLGYDVAVHYAGSHDAAHDVVSQLNAKGRDAIALQADLLIDGAAETLFAEAIKALGGPITCLINNASIFEYDTLQSATPESWDRHINSNLRAPFFLTQAMGAQNLPAEIDENGEPISVGLVVNMLDQRVRKLTPEFMTYTIAKMGLWALTQTSARSLAPSIRVNAIGPGPTLVGARQSDDHFDKQRANTILGRGSNPSDITAALDYFLKSPAVTGQLLCADGGQHLAWKTPDIINAG